jgi:hypothetical protein
LIYAFLLYLLTFYMMNICCLFHEFYHFPNPQYNLIKVKRKGKS